MTKKSLDKIREEKFGTNTFALKYQKDLEQSGFVDEILENAKQVKSWNRYDRELSTKEVVTIVLASVFLGVIASMVITTPVILEMCK